MRDDGIGFWKVLNLIKHEQVVETTCVLHEKTSISNCFWFRDSCFFMTPGNSFIISFLHYRV